MINRYSVILHEAAIHSTHSLVERAARQKMRVRWRPRHCRYYIPMPEEAVRRVTRAQVNKSYSGISTAHWSRQQKVVHGDTPKEASAVVPAISGWLPTAEEKAIAKTGVWILNDSAFCKEIGSQMLRFPSMPPLAKSPESYGYHSTPDMKPA